MKETDLSTECWSQFIIILFHTVLFLMNSCLGLLYRVQTAPFYFSDFCLFLKSVVVLICGELSHCPPHPASPCTHENSTCLPLCCHSNFLNKKIYQHKLLSSLLVTYFTSLVLLLLEVMVPVYVRVVNLGKE